MQYSEIKSLFKYTTAERAIGLLQSNKIFCPKNEKLNDPFDGFIRYIENYASLKKQIKSLNIYENKYDEFVKKVEELIQNQGADVAEIVLSNYGIYSMTIIPDSLLMWSHYADSHKGVCIEFDRSENQMFANEVECKPVSYSNFIRVVDKHNVKFQELIDKRFFHKSDSWAYEREWRYITIRGNLFTNIDCSIKSIRTGCKISKDHLDILKEECNTAKIKLYIGNLSKTKYEINFDET